MLSFEIPNGGRRWRNGCHTVGTPIDECWPNETQNFNDLVEGAKGGVIAGHVDEVDDADFFFCKVRDLRTQVLLLAG